MRGCYVDRAAVRLCLQPLEPIRDSEDQVYFVTMPHGVPARRQGFDQQGAVLCGELSA